MIHLNRGRLREARQCPSANHDLRPPGTVIELLVIHNISLPPGEYGGPWIDDFFANRLDPSRHPYFDEIKDLRVSAHLLVRRTGEIVQYVPLGRRAWHAGESAFKSRCDCNDYSIGIEMEGVDDQPFETIQYDTLALIARAIMQAYPGVTRKRIVGHCDIAPHRKTDPGPAFDWPLLRRLVGIDALGENSA